MGREGAGELMRKGIREGEGGEANLTGRARKLRGIKGRGRVSESNVTIQLYFDALTCC